MPRSALILALLIPASAFAADRAHPTVVELYQSQGCSSCPPADANVNALAERPDVLPLSFAVTYWDRLGWRDSFAKPAFTDRQWAYAKAGGRREVATPQVVVNGRAVVNGGAAGPLAQTIARADRGAGGPPVTSSAGRVTIGAGDAGAPADVWLVRYDPRTLAVPIRAGENGGRTIAHRNIVRSLDRLGVWTGKPASFAVPPGGYAAAILVQRGRGGPILAAARL